MGESAKRRTNVKTDETKQKDRLNGRLTETGKKAIKHFRDLDVYQNALETARCIYELSKKFPDGERSALIDQIRRSSRSVCANIAEHGASGATQRHSFPSSAIPKARPPRPKCHMEFAFRHGYIGNAEFEAINDAYEHVLGQLVRMIDHPEKWVIGGRMNT
jgi:four helix bundle protein